MTAPNIRLAGRLRLRRVKLDWSRLLTRPSPISAYDESMRQAQLEDDRAYSALIAGALTTALLAGAGFGRLILVVGGLASLGWFLGASGLIATCVIAAADTVSRRVKLAAAALFGAVGILVWLSTAFDALPGAGGYGIVASLIWVGLFIASARRRTNLAVFLCAVYLQFGACLPAASKLLQPISLQILAVALEFLLFVGAAYRLTIMALRRLPETTYRVTPLCIVPRLEQATDYPMEICIVQE